MKDENVQNKNVKSNQTLRTHKEKSSSYFMNVWVKFISKIFNYNEVHKIPANFKYNMVRKIKHYPKLEFKVLSNFANS